MRRLLFAYLILAAALTFGGHYAESQQSTDIGRVLDGRMLPGEEVTTFERSDTLYPSDVVRRGSVIRVLPVADKRIESVSFQIGDKRYDLFDYLALNRVAGLLVLKDGKVALEDYELGAGPRTRWASFSMAKSVTSTLIGAALQDGLIDSLDDPVTRYVPALRGSVYDSVSIRNVLEMASGVRWDETYTDPNSDCRKLTDAQMSHQEGASLAYMKGLPRAAPPGSVWNYNPGETNVAAAVVEGATHLSLAAFLSQTLWSPLGMERDATWWTESPGGMGIGGAGVGATLRDYGRFDLFVLSDGVIADRHTVPEGWFPGSRQTSSHWGEICRLWLSVVADAPGRSHPRRRVRRARHLRPAPLYQSFAEACDCRAECPAKTDRIDCQRRYCILCGRCASSPIAGRPALRMPGNTGSPHAMKD